MKNCNFISFVVFQNHPSATKCHCGQLRIHPARTESKIVQSNLKSLCFVSSILLQRYLYRLFWIYLKCFIKYYINMIIFMCYIIMIYITNCYIVHIYFMLLHKKSTKLFRTFYVITTIITNLFVNFWLPLCLFLVVAQKEH
jgi:hypothetical protein